MVEIATASVDWVQNIQGIDLEDKNTIIKVFRSIYRGNHVETRMIFQLADSFFRFYGYDRKY